ncbi:MAG: RdgB/HAM1 family non-canonical purine NTP pyrophosphatase [Bacillota bacterium]
MITKTLLIASNNAHKIEEIKSILGGKFEKILSLKEVGCNLEPEENGETFFDNALIKAREISLATGYATISDDSGIVVDALGGAPGVHSARYSEAGTDEENNKKLLKNLAGKDRTAKFVSSVVLFFSEDEIYSGHGEAHGVVLEEYRGSGGFGYDPLFLSDDLGKTYAEATSEEKNLISHRKRALENLLAKI